MSAESFVRQMSHCSRCSDDRRPQEVEATPFFLHAVGEVARRKLARGRDCSLPEREAL